MEIEVKNLRKSFGRALVLDGLSFRISSGEIVGFLGPNGAGKTTTMRILTGYLAPTGGQVLVDGADLLDRTLEVRRQVGYLPENNPLYPELKVYEYLRFAAAAKLVGNPDREISRVVAACGLRDRVGQTIGTLSKGYRQRVGLGAALLGDPQLVILDEPTSGLDPNQILEIRKLIQEIGKTKTIILSTHILQEVQASCTRVLIIHQGRIVGQGTTAELIRQAEGRRHLRVVVAGPADMVASELQRLPGVHRLEATAVPEEGERAYLIESDRSHDLRRPIFELCRTHGWLLLGLEVTSVSLEDVFRRLTTETIPSTTPQPAASTITVPTAEQKTFNH